jgi:hypothetical protein
MLKNRNGYEYILMMSSSDSAPWRRTSRLTEANKYLKLAKKLGLSSMKIYKLTTTGKREKLEEMK